MHLISLHIFETTRRPLGTQVAICSGPNWLVASCSEKHVPDVQIARKHTPCKKVSSIEHSCQVVEGAAAMRMTVTVEFEMDERAPNPDYSLIVAEQNIRTAIQDALERGNGGMSTGIKRGSVKVTIPSD